MWLLRSYDKDMTLGEILTLLYVLENESVPMPELVEKLQTPQGSMSRYVKRLGVYLEKEKGVSVKKGVNLLTTRPDIYERRRFVVELTPKGKTLRQKILKLDCNNGRL